MMKDSGHILEIYTAGLNTFGQSNPSTFPLRSHHLPNPFQTRPYNLLSVELLATHCHDHHLGVYCTLENTIAWIHERIYIWGFFKRNPLSEPIVVESIHNVLGNASVNECIQQVKCLSIYEPIKLFHSFVLVILMTDGSLYLVFHDLNASSESSSAQYGTLPHPKKRQKIAAVPTIAWVSIPISCKNTHRDDASKALTRWKSFELVGKESACLAALTESGLVYLVDIPRLLQLSCESETEKFLFQLNFPEKSNLGPVSSLQGSRIHLIALHENGRVSSWPIKHNSAIKGELGHGRVTIHKPNKSINELHQLDSESSLFDIQTPPCVIDALDGLAVVGIAASNQFNFAWTSDGIVYGWGPDEENVFAVLLDSERNVGVPSVLALEVDDVKVGVFPSSIRLICGLHDIICCFPSENSVTLQGELLKSTVISGSRQLVCFGRKASLYTAVLEDILADSNGEQRDQKANLRRSQSILADLALSSQHLAALVLTKSVCYQKRD